MKVGIDISQIVYEGTGVATYTKNLIEWLLKVDQKNNYVFFGSSLRRRQKGFWPIPPTVLDILWNRLHILPVENFIGKVDVFHSSDWTQPPTKAKKVTTIHDLVVYKYPESSHPKIVETQRRRLEWVKKECDLIIAVSESTKKDIVEILKIPEEKIKVIYEAVNPIFKPTIKKTKPYILGLGQLDSRKNIERLKTAFHNLKLKGVELKIPNNVPTENLVELYSNALCFVYPSLYEGFGIPILEAFNCGCPVITSNISSLPEVGGEAAIYVDPLRVDDIKEKIDYVLKADREKLAKKGFEQVKKFSWEKTAQETLKIYQSLL